VGDDAETAALERVEQLLERIAVAAEAALERLEAIEARLASLERSQWGPN